MGKTELENAVKRPAGKQHFQERGEDPNALQSKNRKM